MNVNYIFGTPISTGHKSEFLNEVLTLAEQRRSSFVCFCNVHMVVTALENPLLRKALASASLVAPDGAPLAYLLRRFRFPLQQRLSGPDLMWDLLSLAESRGLIVSFYGGREDTLRFLQHEIGKNFPKLQLGLAISPPFRPLTPVETSDAIESLNNCGTQLLFVGLGCPKQEVWMSEMQGSINSVMLGVGAAFDFHSGLLKRAPSWMQRYYLEWLYRLLQEPKRLWKRYLHTNIKFVTTLIFRRGLS